MKVFETHRAVDAAMEVARGFDLAVDDAIVLHESNRLVVRLLPCDTVARVSPRGWFSPRTEVEVARRLAGVADCPVAGLDPRAAPFTVNRDGFEVALWTYFEPAQSRQLPPAGYARALERLHAALRKIEMSAPHFTDRIAEVQSWLGDATITPDLSHAERRLLLDRLKPPSRSLAGDAREQLLHGEPHPWNVLDAQGQLLFIDFENCTRGPIEYDLAWVPQAVSEQYHNAVQEQIGEYRRMVLAIVAAHRWRSDDQHPSGRPSGLAFLDVLRTGPPWPALDDVHW
jgi:Phosphotransferase enzyme family